MWRNEAPYRGVRGVLGGEQGGRLFLRRASLAPRLATESKVRARVCKCMCRRTVCPAHAFAPRHAPPPRTNRSKKCKYVVVLSAPSTAASVVQQWKASPRKKMVPGAERSHVRVVWVRVDAGVEAHAHDADEAAVLSSIPPTSTGGRN